MDETQALKDLGLSDGEVKVYVALLKLGQTTASTLTKETGQHRTTIYDFLDHLSEKGLVSSVIKAGVKYYKAANPEKLIELLKEKEENLKQILPRLKALSSVLQEEISVEVYRGIEGFKSVLSDTIKVGQDFYGFGVDEQMFKEKFPLLLEQYFKKEQEAGIREYNLTREKPKFLYKKRHIQYRAIPEEFFEPTATAVYGDRVFIVIWEPFTTILIKNKGLAEAYRKYHKLLWKTAKKV